MITSKLTRLLRKRVYPIGIDLGGWSIKMVQLAKADNGLGLVAAAEALVPEELRNDPLALRDWQTKQIRRMASSRGFKGSKAVTSLPAQKMLIQHLRVPKVPDAELLQVSVSSHKSGGRP